MLKLKGNITISRISSNKEPHSYIQIEINDAEAGVRAIETTLSMEDFARAVTGCGYIPCEIKFNDSGLVGKIREHKTEIVQVKNGPFEQRKEAAREAVALFEVDGWEGRVDDALNSHKLCSSLSKDGHSAYRVVFVRRVERQA